MTFISKKQEVPVFGDVMANLFEDRFFDPIRRTTAKKSPSVNLSENELTYSIHLAVPGMKKEAFKIDLKNNLLTISAEAKTKAKESVDKFTLQEFNYNGFNRSFKLPKNSDLSNIDAQYNAGILEIKIAKKEKEEFTKTITIA